VLSTLERPNGLNLVLYLKIQRRNENKLSCYSKKVKKEIKKKNQQGWHPQSVFFIAI
jgi:hypothetical protein